MKKIIVSGLLLATISGFGQTKKCSSQIINDRLNKVEAVKNARIALEEKTQEFAQNSERAIQFKKASNKIPVVVHILYRLDSQNKTDEDVQAQIDVLNKDFNRLNTDANQTPTEFLGVAAAVGIEFQLATVDPNGKPTTGIIRKKVTEKNIGNADTQEDKYAYATKGGNDAWDVSKYMNIWVCEIDDAGTLGFAYFPGAAAGFGAPNIDGIVIAPFAFGLAGTDPGVDLGRTTTHEVGHYFNLHHIWADDQAEADQCAKDDLVDDTPLQAGPTESECPASKNTCGSNDMFQNFMDYSTDACMNLFTLGQKTRMLAALNNDRSGLLTTIPPTGFYETRIAELANVYPIPATDFITIDLKNTESAVIELLDLTGSIAYATEQTQSGRAKIPVSQLANGTYILSIISEGKIATTKITIN